MSPAPASAGDAILAGYQIIKIRVPELRQLFNAIDPCPFRERDLDPRAEEFIVEWASDLLRDAPLALLVLLERDAGQADEAALLGEAIPSTSRNESQVHNGTFANCFGAVVSAW